MYLQYDFKKSLNIGQSHIRPEKVKKGLKKIVIECEHMLQHVLNHFIAGYALSQVIHRIQSKNFSS